MPSSLYQNMAKMSPIATNFIFPAHRITDIIKSVDTCSLKFGPRGKTSRAARLSRQNVPKNSPKSEFCQKNKLNPVAIQWENSPYFFKLHGEKIAKSCSIFGINFFCHIWQPWRQGAVYLIYIKAILVRICYSLKKPEICIISSYLFAHERRRVSYTSHNF